MGGRLAPRPEAMAVSARYYGAVTSEHLDRLAGLAAAERERFVQRWPRYRDRFLAATLAQGAALHMLSGTTGVKDLDVVLIVAAIPGERFPEFPRLVKHFDFGPSSLGRQEYDLAAARDDRQRRQWARWAEHYPGPPGGPGEAGAPGIAGGRRAAGDQVLAARRPDHAPEVVSVLSGAQAGRRSGSATPPWDICLARARRALNAFT